MTTRLIIVLYLTSLIPGVPGSARATMFCKACHSVHDPANCHHIESCREGYCAMEVYQLNGARTYTYSCKEHHSCEHYLIGKRGPPGPHHEEGILECKQCCQSTGCEKHLCQDYLPTTTTATKPAITCLNLESSDFRCADLDRYNFCFDVNSALHSIAMERCPLHCGFCDSHGLLAMTTKTTNLPTAIAPTSTKGTSTLGSVDVAVNMPSLTRTTTTAANPCSPSPCVHGSCFIGTGNSPTFFCLCPSGFTGLHCETGVPGPHGATKFCKTCHSVHDPAHCHHIESCREGYCAMEVYQLNGARTYTYSCKDHHSCEHQLIGKRQPPGPHHEEGILECKQCCHSTGCEKYLCHDYLPTTTTHQPHTTHLPQMTHSHTTTHVPATTHRTHTTYRPHTTHSPTTTHLPATTHRPHSTHSPTTTDVPATTHRPNTTHSPVTMLVTATTHLPTTTHSPAITLVTATTHLPATTHSPATTLLTATTHLPTTTHSPPTTLVTATTLRPTTTQSPGTTLVTSTTHLPTTTHSPITTLATATTHLPETTHQPSTTTTIPGISTLGSVDVTVNMGTAFTLGVDISGSGACVDVEDTHFRCSDWQALGFCAPDTVPGYQVSLLQCRKTCDLCDV